MLKKQNKILLIGTILNTIIGLIGLLGIFYTLYQFVGVVPSDVDLELTMEVVETGFLVLLMKTGILLMCLLSIISTIFSSVGFIHKNKSLMLISIIFNIINFIILIFFGPSNILVWSIGTLLSIILMIIGYIKENKK